MWLTILILVLCFCDPKKYVCKITIFEHNLIVKVMTIENFLWNCSQINSRYSCVFWARSSLFPNPSTPYPHIQTRNGSDFYLWPIFSCQFLLRHSARHFTFNLAQCIWLKIVKIVCRTIKICKTKFLNIVMKINQFNFIKLDFLKITH